MFIYYLICSTILGKEIKCDGLHGGRRISKSGPAEEIIERGRAREGAPPLVRGDRGLPRENFEFLALLCAFLMFLCVWDQISVTIFC